MTQLIQITKTSDLLKAKPIVEQISRFGRNDVNNEIAKSLMKCAISVGIELSNHKSQLLVEDLVDKYKYDSIEDIQQALKKGRRGNYGSTYGKLNMIVFTEWMARHLEEKYHALENKLESDKNETDFKGWKTREEYEAAARKPTVKSAKDILKEKEYDFSKFKMDYIRKNSQKNKK